MSTAKALAGEFIRTRPAAAARALETLAPQLAAQFLATLDARAAAPLLREFLPSVAARCMNDLSDQSLSSMLALLPAATAAGLLRRMDWRRRPVMLRAMGRMRAGLIEILLAYPENVVGAWADPTTTLLRAGMRAGDAQRLMRANPDVNDDRVFIVDDTQRICGHVSSTRLAGAMRRQRVEDIAEHGDCSLPASCRLDAALRDPCWRDTRCVAVVDRGGELIGVLRYAQLLAAIGQDDARPASPARDAGADLVDILFGGISAEWDAWADLLGPETAVRSPRDDN